MFSLSSVCSEFSLDAEYIRYGCNRTKKAVLPNNQDIFYFRPTTEELKEATSIANTIWENFDVNVETLRIKGDILYYFKTFGQLSDYLKFRKINEDQIFQQKLPNGKSVIKDIVAHFDKINKSNNRWVLAYIQNYLSDLYRLEKESQSNTSYYLTVTNQPEAFYKMGDYGPDVHSCFGSDNARFKLLPPLFNNSVMWFLSKKMLSLEEILRCKGNEIIGRAYGFLGPSGLMATNFYVKTECSALMQKHILAFYRRFINKECEKSNPDDKFQYEDRGLYLNTDTRTIGTIKPTRPKGNIDIIESILEYGDAYD